ncbi:MAG: hypothetical protein J4432_01190 [DPANN group archaeon]|nr:hypothetical protein [DPANN group archaeon]
MASAVLTQVLGHKKPVIIVAFALVLAVVFVSGFADEAIQDVSRSISDAFEPEAALTAGHALGTIDYEVYIYRSYEQYYYYKNKVEEKERDYNAQYNIIDHNLKTKIKLENQRREILSLNFNRRNTLSKVRIKGSGWFVVTAHYYQSNSGAVKDPSSIDRRLFTLSGETTPVKASKKGVDIDPVQNTITPVGVIYFQSVEVYCTSKYFDCTIYGIEIYP